MTSGADTLVGLVASTHGLSVPCAWWNWFALCPALRNVLCIPVGGLHHLALCLVFNLDFRDIFLVAAELFVTLFGFSLTTGCHLTLVCVIFIQFNSIYNIWGIALSYDWLDFELIFLVVSHFVVGLCD